MERFVTRALIVMASILGIVFAQVAPASAQASDELASNLATLWTTVLETKSAQNPFAQDFDPKLPCWNLDHSAVAPFAGGAELSCKVKSDTKIFVVGFSFECSSIPGDDGDPPFTEANLRDCAVNLNKDTAPTVTPRRQVRAADGGGDTCAAPRPAQAQRSALRRGRICQWRTAGSLF